MTWTEAVWDAIDRAVAAVHRAPVDERMIAIRQIVPPPGTEDRVPVLLTLLRIELERAWTSGQCCLVEQYLDEWPELGEQAECLDEMVEAEYRARIQRTGNAPDLEDFRRRFPQWSGRIDVEEIHSESNVNKLPHDEASNALLQTVTRSMACGRETQASALPIGAHLDRYRVLSLLGKGAMGVVYLGKDGLLDRLVAIKVLHSQVAKESTLGTLCDEARAAAKLKHPSIVPVHDVGVSQDGTPYLVMTFIEGESLADELARGPLSVARATLLAGQIGSAISAAHNAGFTHRDIKPANILVDLEGNAHITDFGLAIQHREHSGDEYLAGTPAYMSPEQLEGRQIDHRTDIWSLGVVLYEMLTGQLPFPADCVTVLTNSITQSPPNEDPLAREGIPGWLSKACLQCLERRPEDRFQSAADVEAAMSAPPNATTPKTPEIYRRLALLSFALVAIAALSIGALFPRSGRRAPSRDLSLTPWIEECELGVAMNLAVAVDIEKAHEQFRVSPGSFFGPGSIQVNASRRGQYRLDRRGEWLCFEAPLALQDLMDKRESDAFSAPSEFGLRLRFAINANGRILLGTVGEKTQHHLLMLTSAAGVSNYADFADSNLTPEQYENTPRDFMLENGLWQTHFGRWLRSIAIELERKGATIDGPRDNVALRRSPTRVFNHLDSDITVVTTLLFHQQFTHHWLKDQRRTLVDQRTTELWSPIADNPSQHANLSTTFRFKSSTSSPIAMTMQAVTDGNEEGAAEDEFNASQITVRGRHLGRIQQQTKNSELTSIRFEDQGGASAITAKNKEVSSAIALIYDFTPTEVEFQAQSTYSMVRPIVRFAKLGTIEFDSAEWAPQGRSKRPIEPLIWRILHEPRSVPKR